MIFTIAATSDDPAIHKFEMLLGQLMMMGADMGMSAMAQGATVGFTTSFIASGGDMGQAILGALTTATSTGMSFGIGETFGHGFSLEGALAHGTVQGMISVMRGGTFQNGFINGFLGKISGSLTKSLFAGASPEAMTFGGGAIATIMGGIAAEATGGDFAEGALTAMVVFLYNEINIVGNQQEVKKVRQWLSKIRKVPSLSKRLRELEKSKLVYTIKLKNSLNVDLHKGGLYIKQGRTVLLSPKYLNDDQDNFWYRSGSIFFGKNVYCRGDETLVHELLGHGYDDLRGILLKLTQTQAENNAIRITNSYREINNRPPRNYQ